MSALREYIGLSIIVALVATVISVLLFDTYLREIDFLHYRLAVNLHNGYGMVYNPNATDLLTFSPLWILPLAVAPFDAALIAAVLYVVGLAIAGLSLARFLHHAGFSQFMTVSTLLILVLSLPVWAGFRSPATWAFALIVTSLVLIDAERPHLAGLLAGLTLLLQPQALAGLLVAGIYAGAESRRYWQIVWIPAAIWALIALVSYDVSGLALPPPYMVADWRDALWLGLFVVAVLMLSQREIDRRLWIFPLWAALEIGGEILFAGQLLQVTSLPLALTVALGGVIIMKRFAPALIVAVAVLLVAFPPQTPAHIQADLNAAENLALPVNTSIAHDRSDAFTYALSDGATAIYRLDGERSTHLHHFVQRDDLSSMLVMLAPDYVYAESFPVEPDAPNIAALNYTQTSDSLWERTAQVTLFDANQTINTAFGSDVTLAAIRLAENRLDPEKTLRFALDWSLNRLPEDIIGININLLDFDGNPISSIFPTFPVENWQPLDIITYHAIDVPAELQPGIHTLQVTLDYRAGILGSHQVGEVIVPLPQPENLENLIGTLGDVGLYVPSMRVQDGQLILDMIWQASATLEQSYRVFVHVALANDPQPRAQDDGLPLNGRYPTRIWQPDEIISETRMVDISNLAPGDYVINIGLYTPETGRLQGENGDFLRPGTLTINLDGTANVD